MRDPNYEYVEAQTARPCFACQALTTKVDMDFEAYLCSPACTDKTWAAYWAEQDKEGRRR